MRTAGVYTITHTPSGRVYVGSTQDIVHRFATHRRHLSSGKRGSRQMQEDWQSDGPEAFVFEVVEHVDGVEALFEAEVRWFGALRPVYNLYAPRRCRRSSPIRGVYAITHNASGARYIGLSNDIKKRFGQHLDKLRQGKSGHRPLQRAWNEHGEGAFSFDILEVVEDASLLLEAEQRWMNATPVLLNRAAVAGTPRGFQRDADVVDTLKRAFKTRKRPATVRRHVARGEAATCHVLSEQQVREIRTRGAAGERYKDIARDYPVTPSMISRIMRRVAWAHI